MTSKARRLIFKTMAFALMTAMLGVMTTSYRAREREMDALRGELDALNAMYFAASMRGNSVQTQINQADEDAFVERVARRDYGYMIPGDIHYRVTNLPRTAQMDAVASLGEAK